MRPSFMPLIGVTMRLEHKADESNHYISSFYAESVTEAGGIPVYLPIIPDDTALLRGYVERLDGLLLTGDADIPPDAYGEEPVPQTKAMPRERYEFERRLIELYLETKKPLLGICLGCQFVNVVLGGTLIQDVPTIVGTNVIHKGQSDVEHPVRIEPQSLLGKTLGVTTAQIYSSHHQAVKKFGRSLRPVAWAEDGVVEALEPECPGGQWLLLVQWHPERMPNTEVRTKLFRALVEASQDKISDCGLRIAD
jgi:putative glutamine amidotransferase